ncbi:unnamed protein product [Ilex paraguariensis]|uniref:Pentatricopeptide repeat-containing protein n=1 Tax=Ilex paraguariensis TaxID=185542 RepID=A0ABC8TL67_9AQUA
MEQGTLKLLPKKHAKEKGGHMGVSHTSSLNPHPSTLSLSALSSVVWLGRSGHLLLNSHTSPRFKWMNTLLYNTLIRAYLSFGLPHRTIVLFTHMLAHQAPPNSNTFPSLIKVASSSPCLASHIGKPLHTHVIKRGVTNDPFVQTCFVVYAGQTDLKHAHIMFDEISEPCIVSNNAMVDAFRKNGDMGSAILTTYAPAKLQ